MIPNLVSKELKDTLLDYLDTTFSLQDRTLASALEEFLRDKQRGMFKGPYLNMKLPFRKHDGASELPLDIKPDFTPYKHQMIAFERLSSQDGHTPESTLITTGTGSGKTECFLYPIIDHVYRNIGKPGIKALILYPMNALAFDQARRIAGMIYDDPALKNNVTAGMYVGGHGKQRAMGPDFVLTDKEIIQKHPPDILLTNYKMLDYLLMRPEDQALWKNNSPETLQYIVLDELHTYDGVQGGDVACLLRRLRAKLNAPEGVITPVGTSATLSNDDEDAMNDLIEFAQHIYGSSFSVDSIITEDRLSADEFFPQKSSGLSIPETSIDMDILPNDDIDSYVKRQTKLWFGSEMNDELVIGQHMLNHEFTRTIFEILDNHVLIYHDCREELSKQDASFGKYDKKDQDRILNSFLALLSYSKRDDNGRVTPLTTVQFQVWIREMRRMMRELSPSPKFFWRDEVPRSSNPKGLPMVFCRECGYSGWVTVKRADDSKIEDDNAAIARAVIDERSKKVHYLFPGENPDELFQFYVCSKCMRLSQDKECAICSEEGVVVQVHNRVSQAKNPRDVAHCPSCDTNFVLSIAGSQAASLSSVAISHLFQSGFNDDKKLLAFTDSVQDASHRASFFAARTYRFGLRTAMQTIMEEESSGNIPLVEFTDRFFTYWLEELDSNADFIATFMPPDLREIHQYRDYMDEESSAAKKRSLENELLRILEKRLSWEFSMEYGLNLRLGRTLTKSLCSAAYIPSDMVSSVVNDLTPILKNEIGVLRGIDSRNVEKFIVGIFSRMIERGAIDHPMVKGYIESENRFMLTKYKNPYMSPFGGNIRLPKYLTSKQSPVIFDSYIVTNALTWFVDWSRRTLNENIDNGSSNDIYECVIKYLCGKKILKSYTPTRGRGKVFALDPKHIHLSRNLVSIMSPKDGSHQTVPIANEALWENMPTLSFRGKNNQYQKEEDPQGTYYQKIYKSKRIKRIFAHEHSSILEREKREEVESLFKDGGVPDAPNLITCTPTMEMGIDVGDLSATMVCSIPPSTTNYLQRIGRAGRSTGNALVLALANARPHDLYFYENPKEMISGIIHTPGCFLNAPEMLKRHFTAYCMDKWADTALPGDLPNKMSFIIKEGKKSGFPATFYDFYAQNKQDLIQLFLTLFSENDLSEDNKIVIEEFALNDQAVFGMTEVFTRVEKEADELKRVIDRVKKQKKKIEKNPNTVDDAPGEIDRCNREVKAIQRQRKELYWGAYPLNILTNYGILPNYAFPEEGVKLTSIITGIEVDDGEGGISYAHEVHEYRRGAATAIKEFAPQNIFYGEGRKVEIDLIETGGLEKSNIVSWRFCSACSHMEEIRPGDAPGSCPKCGSVMWKDNGQRHDIIQLRAVGSKVVHLKSLTADEADERERKTYVVKDFIEMNEDDLVGGFYAEGKVFGYEFVKHCTLTEINFGQSDALGQKMIIAGDEIPEVGFTICSDCGIVDKSKDPEKPTQHRRHCRFYDKPKEVVWRNSYLYRKLQSEAIRILLPVSAFAVPEKLHTFKAALELGFKKLFKGNPGHLLIKEQAEPLNDEEGAFRQYLVICDTVPGGTGYLKDLVYSGGLLKAMRYAYDTLKNCSCNDDEILDGCYKCIYAHKHQFQIEKISRNRAIRMLEDILSYEDNLKEITNLSTISIDSVLESELEERFVDTLQEYCLKNDDWKWEDVAINGKPGGLLTTGKYKWKVEPQVEIGDAEGISEATRPDIVFWPEEGNPGMAIALYLDGYKYHVSPNKEYSAMSRDIDKRHAIIKSKKFNVWTLTWYDLEEFGEQNDGAHLFSSINHEGLNRILQKSGVQFFQAAHLNVNPVQFFFNYLVNPSQSDWEKIAMCIIAVYVTANRYNANDIERVSDQLLESNDLSSIPFEPSDDPQDPFAKIIKTNFITHLSSAPIKALQEMSADNVNLITRIEVDRESRDSGDYRGDWRIFWQTINIIQFMPNMKIVSDEQEVVSA